MSEDQLYCPNADPIAKQGLLAHCPHLSSEIIADGSDLNGAVYSPSDRSRFWSKILSRNNNALKPSLAVAEAALTSAYADLRQYLPPAARI